MTLNLRNILFLGFHAELKIKFTFLSQPESLASVFTSRRKRKTKVPSKILFYVNFFVYTLSYNAKAFQQLHPPL